MHFLFLSICAFVHVISTDRPKFYCPPARVQERNDASRPLVCSWAPSPQLIAVNRFCPPVLEGVLVNSTRTCHVSQNVEGSCQVFNERLKIFRLDIPLCGWNPSWNLCTLLFCVAFVWRHYVNKLLNFYCYKLYTRRHQTSHSQNGC